MMQPSLRSTFAEVHLALHDAYLRDEARVFFTMDSLVEMLCAGITAPLSRMCLLLPFCSRVEASDASPGGHGRAY